MSTHGQWAEVAKRLKLDRVRRYGLTNNPEVDMPCTTLVVRGEDTIAMLYGDGPDGGRATAYWAALLFRPDEVISLSDSYFRTTKSDDPADFAQGSISADWQAGRREGISESIVAVRMTADEPAVAIMFPYERTRQKVRWLPWDGPSTKVEGAIADYCQEGFKLARESPMPISEFAAKGDAIHPGSFERACARLASEKHGVAGVVVLWPKASWWRGGKEE
jgi:hypothetical protein